MIDMAHANGYKMVTVGQCLGDPEENWYRDATTGEPVAQAHVSAIAHGQDPPVVEKKGKGTGKGTDDNQTTSATKPSADDPVTRKGGADHSMTMKPTVKGGAGHTLEAPAAAGCLLGFAAMLIGALFAF
jgi:hypothetical protein